MKTKYIVPLLLFCLFACIACEDETTEMPRFIQTFLYCFVLFCRKQYYNAGLENIRRSNFIYGRAFSGCHVSVGKS